MITVALQVTDPQVVGRALTNAHWTFQYGNLGEVFILVSKESEIKTIFDHLEFFRTLFSKVLKGFEIRTSGGDLWRWSPIPRTTQEERNWLRCLCNEAWEGRAQELLLRVLDEADAADPNSKGVS